MFVSVRLGFIASSYRLVEEQLEVEDYFIGGEWKREFMFLGSDRLLGYCLSVRDTG